MTRFRLPLLLALFALPCAASAHRLDEYLQATIVVIEPSSVRLQINLTPGMDVAKQVLAVIDRNSDGVISTNEAAAYADLFKRDLKLHLDGRNLQLKLTTSEFPAPAELRTGWGIITLEFSAAIVPLAPDAHKLALTNRHLSPISVYLINAAQPTSTTLEILKQQRNDNQSTAQIEFTLHPR